ACSRWCAVAGTWAGTGPFAPTLARFVPPPGPRRSSSWRPCPVRKRRAPGAFRKLTTCAGEQAQVDWGHFGKIQVGAATRSLSCFVLVLSWSRAMYARFTLDQTLETILYWHWLTLGETR